MPGFVLLARNRGDGDDSIRLGLTCSKKLGNAVIRNRAKRRLREAARSVLPRQGRGGWDYVLVGREEATVSRAFARILAELERALIQLHEPQE